MIESNQSPGPTSGATIVLPTRGSFAASEVLPMIQRAAAEMHARGGEWRRLREEADQKRAEAKRIRAGMILTLRVWGAEQTGNIPIKTSAERVEWANGDPAVQQADLEADLAQTVSMYARENYNDAQSFFNTLQSLQAIERDDLRREYVGPQ